MLQKPSCKKLHPVFLSSVVAVQINLPIGNTSMPFSHSIRAVNTASLLHILQSQRAQSMVIELGRVPMPAMPVPVPVPVPVPFQHHGQHG